ncbi:MAG: hypothetical protein G8D88_18940, partial [gamma proteobacterium symbiont of Ctena orbiculata]
MADSGELFVSNNSQNTNELIHGVGLTQNEAAHIISTRNYSLNIDRALRTKLEACDAVSVKYEVTGGGVTGKLDTASFELFRSACTAFYKDFPETDGRCVPELVYDKYGVAVVQQTYRVKRFIDENEVCYTLNLYPTNNSMLLNGRDIDQFMNFHLPVIHELMCKSVKDEGLQSVSNYNFILATQFRKVLDERQSNQAANSEARLTEYSQVATDAILDNGLPKYPSGGAKLSSASPSDTQCPRCKRKCQTRSAYCENGSHWIHYYCDRLTEGEIDRLHNDQGFIYVCKQCRKTIDAEEETELKGVASKGLENGVKRILAIPDVSGGSTDPDVTLAAAVLKEEEQGEVCSVCYGEMVDCGDRCSKCLTTCHEGCMLSDLESGDVCISCAAANDQRLQHKDRACGTSVSSMAMVVDAALATHSKMVLTTMEADMQCSQQYTPTDAQSQPTESQDTSGVIDRSLMEVSPERIQTDSDLMVEIDVKEQAQVKGKFITGDDKAKPSHKVAKKSTSDITAVKQRELRQQDLKLRRWEEELKLREAKLSDMENCVKRLEEYLSRTEARNVELEKTVRNLQRKICLLDSSSVKSTH